MIFLEATGAGLYCRQQGFDSGKSPVSSCKKSSTLTSRVKFFVVIQRFYTYCRCCRPHEDSDSLSLHHFRNLSYGLVQQPTNKNYVHYTDTFSTPFPWPSKFLWLPESLATRQKVDSRMNEWINQSINEKICKNTSNKEQKNEVFGVAHIFTSTTVEI